MEWLVDVHSIWRWLILIIAIVSVVLAAMSAFGTRPWDGLSDRFSFFFTIALDVQVLIGAIIWLVEQAWTRDAFVAFVHPILMIAAVALAHIGRARTDRATAPRAQGRTALTFFLASLIVIIIAVPTAAWPI
jgi:hypothetical protein